MLFAAAAYNVLWGTWVGLFPKASFDLLGIEVPKYLPLWQSVDTIQAVDVGLVAADDRIGHTR